ncbi:PepSY domain-containing protein [Abyssibacter profundi]|uniref:PepSY domain-containing protein n=1 Tax=Abyssibacter profundi TaxID=2182787 RepID=A0A363UK02_9GAMM|nr:PepSY domain-containing protein [Abyssibacter profundi]MBR9814085.1 PepSY domain-containing protein [bacterium]MEC9407882.1 PepSY domain-containing protein [Pseudomonadota bacterium]PWN55751.1 PepSY domain-containing protein [Abyssibacter profundi]
MLWRRRVRQVHRWLGLLIAIQLTLWVAGGFTMAFLDLDAVRGAHRVANAATVDLRAAGPVSPPGDLLAGFGKTVTDLRLTHWLGQPVYRVETSNDSYLIDARTGARLDPIESTQALAVAQADYAGDASGAVVRLVDTPHYETRGRELPLWQIAVNDDLGTRIYVSPQTGEVVARRNNLWRIFDFVWMLHIMDYDDRDDFNHPLLLITAGTALLFVISGLWMLVFAFRRKSRGSRTA